MKSFKISYMYIGLRYLYRPIHCIYFWWGCFKSMDLGIFHIGLINVCVFLGHMCVFVCTLHICARVICVYMYAFMESHAHGVCLCV